MSTEKEGVFEIPVMSIKDLKDFSQRFEKLQVQMDSHKEQQNNGQENVAELNQSDVVTTEHINALHGNKVRRNSKQHHLWSTHQDLFSEDFASTPDELFKKDNNEPELSEEEEKIENNNSSIYSSFSDVSLVENDKYIQLKVEDKEGNKFGINFPVIDEGKSLAGLNMCNIEKLSNMSDEKLDSSMENLTKLVDKVYSDSLSEGKKEWKPVYGAFEVDFSSALNELSEMEEYQKKDKTMILFSEGCDNDNGYKVAIQPNSPLAKKWDKEWGNQHDSELPDKDLPKFGIELKTITTRSLGEDDEHPIILFGTSEYENGKNSFQAEMSSNITKYMKGEIAEEEALFPQNNTHRRKTPVIKEDKTVSFDI